MGTSRNNFNETSKNKENKNDTKSSSKQLVPKKTDDQEKIASNENKVKPWNVKFIQQVTDIDYSILTHVLDDRWKQEGKCIEIHLPEKRLNAKIQAIERAVNYRYQLDQIYRRKKQQEIDEYPDSSESDDDPHHDCPIYGSKKNYIEPKYISAQNLIDTLTAIFDENTYWDIGFLAPSWLNQDYPHYLYSLCPCGKFNKAWLQYHEVLENVDCDGQPGLCKNYQFKDNVSFFKHIRERAQQQSLIHYGLWQYLNILYPNLVKPPKQKKNVSDNEKNLMNNDIYDITVVKR